MPQAIAGVSTSTPPAYSQAGGGLLRVVSPAELDEQERRRLSALSELNRPNPLPADLGAFVRTRWQIMRNARNSGDNNLNDRLLRAQRMFEGKYDPQKLFEIKKFGGSEVYARLVAVKCRGANSLLRDVYLGPDRPWDIDPQPDPPVPMSVKQDIMMLVQTEVQNLATGGQPIDRDAIQQRISDLLYQAAQAARRQAMRQADNASDTIEDLLQAGNFYDALAEFLTDLPLFPFACIKGPVVRMVPRLMWNQGRAVIEQKPQMFWERIDPFNIYWSPGVARFADCEVIERKRLTRTDLNDLLGLPGYDQDAVRGALQDYGRGLRDWMDAPDTEAALAAGREDPNFNQSQVIDAIEYHGNVQGQILFDQGVPHEDVPDLDRDYAVQTWVVGRHVLKTQFNPSPRQRHPYYLTSFEKVPGTVAGHGLPDILEDQQEVANATLRALVNNMCLTGDTVVYRHPRHGGKRQDPVRMEVTLAQLWEQKQRHNSGLRRNVIRAVELETGKLVGRRIADIHDNGVQDVFRIRTHAGYEIRATATHRFLADDGSWGRVENLRVGQGIGVNGSVEPLRRACIDCGVALSAKLSAIRCKSCAVSVPGSWNDRQARAALGNRDASATTARGRKFVQARKKAACEVCGGVDRLHVHHLDKDPWNCAPENLKTLCEPCHKEWHVRYGNFGAPRKHMFVDFDRIISIEYIGREQTYCLTMVGEPNFIANGFVSHNSLASGPQVVINDDCLAPTENADSLFPWKRWHVINDPLANTRDPVSFFQPNSNAQELLSIYQAVVNMADDISAIPRYTTGESLSGGAGRTASGLSMLMNNASKILQTVASNVDIDVMKGLLTGAYDMIMLTDDTGMLSGEEEIVVNGVKVAIQKETERQKQLQFLQITANPIDASIIGEPGRARVLRAVSANLGMPDDVVPDDQAIMQKLKAQQEVARAMAQVEAQKVPEPDPRQGAGTRSSSSPASRAQGAQAPAATPSRFSDLSSPINSFQQGAPYNG